MADLVLVTALAALAGAFIGRYLGKRSVLHTYGSGRIADLPSVHDDGLDDEGHDPRVAALFEDNPLLAASRDVSEQQDLLAESTRSRIAAELESTLTPTATPAEARHYSDPAAVALLDQALESTPLSETLLDPGTLLDDLAARPVE